MSIQSKHFLNTPESLVVDSLQGLCALNPALELDTTNKIVYLASRDPSKVALICGGGSGHEPAHAGFVGDGMLSAAVCGSVFASPSSGQVKHGIELVDNEKGVVIIVKNYTGDVLNFGLAKEQYAAQHPERPDRARFVIVGDDVAVTKSQGKIVGRRGLAGTILVYKIAGALAKRGASLDEVASIAEWAATRLGSIGVGLEHCHVPGTASTESHLGSTEIEIGMGIHNEPGNRRLSPVPSLKDLIAQLLEHLLSTSDPERSFLPFKGQGDKVVLLVNNLGGTSELELGAIAKEACQGLKDAGVSVERVISGTFMTSLNMPGFSLTLLLLPSPNETGSHPESSLILSLLDESTNAPGWKWSSGAAPGDISSHATAAAKATQASGEQASDTAKLTASDPNAFIEAIKRACAALVKEEPEITRMDNIAGDGDCGLTLKAGATAVLKEVEEGRISGSDVVGSIIAISKVAEEQMGGTSGALYSIFFSGLAQGLQQDASKPLTPTLWAIATSIALKKLYSYTRARPPSRTLVDPLDAFVKVLGTDENPTTIEFAGAVKAAADAALNTRDLEAKAGRSAYVEGDRLRTERVADPGAWGVKTILEALLG